MDRIADGAPSGGRVHPTPLQAVCRSLDSRFDADDRVGVSSREPCKKPVTWRTSSTVAEDHTSVVHVALSYWSVTMMYGCLGVDTCLQMHVALFPSASMVHGMSRHHAHGRRFPHTAMLRIGW